MKAFEPTRYRDPEEPYFSIMSKKSIVKEKKNPVKWRKYVLFKAFFCDFYFYFLHYVAKNCHSGKEIFLL